MSATLPSSTCPSASRASVTFGNRCCKSAADSISAVSRFDGLALPPPVEPMETRQAAQIPQGASWTYEPKWDGFRCLAFRDDDDVELHILTGDTADFDALLQRSHPAESRVRKLARETPASYVIFDLLVENATPLYEQTLSERRKRLGAFAEQNFGSDRTIRI